MNGHGGSWLTAILPFLIIAVVFAFRFRSMGKTRPLRTTTLWVMPAILVLLMGSTLFALPPPLLGWVLVLFGLAAGAVLGWHRGKLIHIERDAKTGGLTQRASPLAMLLLLAIVVLKLGAKEIFGDSAAAHPGSGALLMTDALVGFAMGLLSATRLELYLRARRIMSARING